MKNPTFRLRQIGPKNWTCRTAELPNVTSKGADPNAAIEAMQTALEDFREFSDHLHGRCGVKCSRCAAGNQLALKGVWNRGPSCST